MKKILTIMALLVAFVTTGFAQKTVYFNPNVWAADNPVFAVHYWGGADGAQWVELDAVTGEEGFYKASIPDDATGMLFGRFQTGTTEFGFNTDLWNKSEDASVNDGYLYTITGWGSGNSPVSSVQVIPSNVLVAGDGEITKDFQNWVSDPTQSSNKMTLDNGFTYKLTIEGQVIKAGTYEYKIVEDGDWYPQTNANAQLVIAEDGVYTIVYTFNVRTNAYDALATKTADATITYKYFVQEYASGAYTSLGEMTTVTEGENANKFAALKINRTITEATTLAFKYEKVMYNGTTVVRDEWIGGNEAGDDNMYNLTQEINEAGTYDITFNFWFENKTNWVTVEKYAEITSVKVMGSFDTWGNGIELTKGTGYTYTGTIPVSAAGEEFCIKVNENTWVKYGENAATLAEDYDFVTTNNDNNFVLSGDYESYAITATWTPSANAGAGWLLTIVPGEARPKSTYTATFVNGAGWENVYAYIWKVDGETPVPLNGNYPGVQIEKTGTETINTVAYDVYTFTFETYDETAVPQYIIFSDGGNTNKTDDLAFVNGKKYTETVPGNAEIESVVVTVPGAPVDPFDITTCKTEDANGNYVYSRDMDLSVVLDDIPFNFTINGDALPVSADMLDPSDNNLLSIVEKTVYGVTVKSYVLNNEGSGYAVYTATATWTPNPSATSQWKLLVVGKEARPETTTYSIIYNTNGQNNNWKVGDTMTESEGVFTATISNKPGMLFAIAPTGSVALDTQNPLNSGIQWAQIIRPVVTTDNDFEVQYFHNYSDATEVKETGGKVWKIMSDNTSKLTLTFTPADNTYTIVSDATEKVNITNVGWATYSLSKPFKVEDADVYIVTGVADGEADMVKLAAGAEIPAGTGVILNGDAGEYTVKPSLGNGDVAGNMLIGTGESPNGYDITGIYPQEMGGGEYTAYIFANKSLGVGFYLLDSSNGNTIAPFKAFLAVPKNTNQTPAPFFGFGGEGTTGINSVERGVLNVEGCYTLDGRRVENPTKGLYIINGKKVVIK